MDVDDEDDIGMDCFVPTQTESNVGGELDDEMEEEEDDDEEEDEDYEDAVIIEVTIVNEQDLEGMPTSLASCLAPNLFFPIPKMQSPNTINCPLCMCTVCPPQPFTYVIYLADTLRSLNLH